MFILLTVFISMKAADIAVQFSAGFDFPSPADPPIIPLHPCEAALLYFIFIFQATRLSAAVFNQQFNHHRDFI
jgi:hypothetical protein